MPTTTNEAQAALEAARAAHTALEEAIREGDETITSAQLAEASADIRTAVLRLEAAQRAEERTAEASRAHDAEVVRQEFEHLIGKGSEKARKAYAAAVTALRELAAEVDSLNDRRAALQGRAGDLSVTQRGAQLPFWDTERVVNGDGRLYSDLALKDAQGYDWPHPHALHGEAFRAEFTERAERLAEAERERQERVMASAELVDDRGNRVVVD